jgi:tetratricopeptide (TPR) repeat protein
MGLRNMKEQSVKPKSLRHRSILLIESVAVFLAVIVTLAYLNEPAPATELPDTSQSDVAGWQATVSEQASEPVQVATIDIDVIRAMAWEEVARGNYQAAIAQYNLVLATYPNDGQSLMERGITHARLGDHDRAIEDYTAAAYGDSDNALVYYNRGISYDALGMTELALADYDKSINQDDLYAYSWNNRGYVYASQGDWAQAINNYTQAIALDPSYATAYNNRAIAYVQIGQLEKAQADYEMALELDPNYQDASYNYGILMYKLGDYQSAMNAFHAVVKSNVEKTPQIWNNHGSALHRLGQYHNAIQSYTRALNLDYNYELARLNRAIAYRDLGDYEASVADYDTLLTDNPYRYDWYLARGNVLESIEFASDEAGMDYFEYLRRNGIIPHSMEEVSNYEFRKEFKISRNQFHQFRVYISEGNTLDFSVSSSRADGVDPMMVVTQNGMVISGNDDTDQTLNSALFDVMFEQSGWVNVYIGLAGGGADSGQVLFSIQPAE